MTFQQLKYVVEIANCGSINRAATKLFVSQSSVSCALSQLEDELHTELFTRNNSGVILTDTGKDFISYATSILERKAEMENIFVTKKKTHSRVKFSVASQHYQFSSAAFVKLLKQHDPEMYYCTYLETCMDEIIDSVANSSTDIGVIIISNIAKGLADYYLSKKNLDFHMITELQPCVFCSRDHPLAKKRSLHLEEVSRYPYVTYSHNQELPIDFSEGVNKLALKDHKKHIKTNSRNTLINLLCNTDAFSTGSGLLTADFADPRVISIPLDDTEETMQLGWIDSKGRPLSQIAKDYVDLLSETISDSIAYTKRIWDKSWLTQ